MNTNSMPFVASLTWVMKDSLGEELDVLDDPVDFLVGGDDLLPVIDQALAGRSVGETVNLYIDPENGFGDFDDQLIFLIPRDAMPQEIEVGMSLEGNALQELGKNHAKCRELTKDAPRDALYTVSDIYPEHIVLDGNHPLAGISLALTLKIHHIRPATVEEVGRGSAGVGFFKIQSD